ncbi:ABC transporter ATP-binding protein [Pontibacter sp. CAU 1760]
MSDIVIQVENISKQYRLGEVGTGSLSHDINRWWHKVRGKEDPYLKVGEENNREQIGNSDYVWALKDINFDVKQGEILGIVGRNGAGKSTLLKLLSRTTTPTTGSIKIKGRVASLLEVGTGFHPELSGRDNIYLNGAILGMTRNEIKNKFDEIVDFAGVERYIDTPVKRYSSGMYVRLAFAVAAHLEPEILIVDEVLAVGDIDFQKKCLGKLKDISGNYGRTVLFVSHNLASLKNLSTHGILMHNGLITYNGSINDTIAIYENQFLGNLTSTWTNSVNNSSKVDLKSIKVLNKDRFSKQSFLSSEPVLVEMEVFSKMRIENVKIGFDLIKDNEVVFRTHQIDSYNVSTLEKEVHQTFTCNIAGNLLNEGTYSIKPHFSIHCVESLIKIDNPVIQFKVVLDTSNSIYHSILNENNHPGSIFPILNWDSQVHS